MELLADIIARIERERAKFAQAALVRPTGHESFDYGRACGVYAGLTMAAEIINAVIEERDDADRRK